MNFALLTRLPLQASIAVAAALLGAAPAAHAQSISYTLQPGENLYGLAKRLLHKPEQWKQIQLANKVRNPLRLLPGTLLMIPVHLLRPQPALVTILHAIGDAHAALPGQAKELPLQKGQQLPQGSQLTVGEQGFVTLQLADGSTIRLPANTQVQLSEVLYAPASKDIQATIQLDRGRVESKVVPLPSANSRFEIRTPHAVGGVRGTDFGVAIGDNGTFLNDVREGAVQVNALASHKPGAQALVHAGEGSRLGASDSQFTVAPLLPAPDLSQIPSVLEDVSFIELPLPGSTQATSYQVMIATDNTFNQVLRYGSFAPAMARFTGLDDGDYQLAVRPVDPQGIVGREAVRLIRVKARPEAPFMQQPQQGSQLFTTAVDMRCTENSGAQGYHLQLAHDPGFQNLAADLSYLPACSHTAHDLAPGAYFWRVASVKNTPDGARDQGPYSKPASFTLLPIPPKPPAPSIHADGASLLSVQWGTSQTQGVRYRLQLAHDIAFNNLLDDSVVNASQYVRPLPPAGVYYVRLQQLDQEGRGGAFTAAQSVMVPGRLMASDQQPVVSSDGTPLRPGKP
nr:FecR domain-containing protein [uncultured Albidiferax sp.]